MNINKTEVEKIPAPESGYKLYRDDTIRGFAIRVTANGVKTFVLEKRINGKFKRINIGRFGEITPIIARKQAQALLGEIATGGDPLANRAQKKINALTLEDLTKTYLKARKLLKPSTVADYQRLLNEGLNDWRTLPIANISKDAVLKKHEELSKRSPARANLTMRYLRALFNFAYYEYEDAEGKSLFPDNPVKKLSQRKAWNRIKRKETFIKFSELKAWLDAVRNLQDMRKDGMAATVKVYLQFLLFTGLRKTEAATLLWEQVNFKEGSLIVRDPKNRKDLMVPFSDYTLNLLQKHWENAGNKTGYIFADGSGESHLKDVREQVEKVSKISGARYTPHDFRRTYITIAESLDISPYTLKRLVNHSLPKDDVTAGYVGWDVERLRVAQQAITNRILELAQIDKDRKIS
jgi:integrase